MSHSLRIELLLFNENEYLTENDTRCDIFRCASTGKAIPKDKAIKRFIVRNIVDASSLRDIKEASAYQEYQLPKLYLKMYYCVEAAVHQRIVRGRSREARRIRTPPERKFVRKN